VSKYSTFEPEQEVMI